jgi:hypothetical protein
MAARQIWLFLTEVDVGELLERVERHDPGVLASRGRYFRGEASQLLTDSSALERRESLPRESRHYLFHRKHSADVIGHVQPAGPFAGWSQLDEERSDCLVLRVPQADVNEIGPSRLYAHTSFWRGPTKIRKRPAFALWANQTLRWLLSHYPSASIDFMRIGSDALSRARSRELRLSYLYREIAPEPEAHAAPIAAPEGTLTSTTPEEDD